MCGLSGFAGVSDFETRKKLIFYLGFGIDERGGHAAGYITQAPGRFPIVGRKPGYWLAAKEKFIRRAAEGTTTLMHARFATCGKRTVEEAHPFTIERDGSPVIWGAHNGIIYNADESAWIHNRSYDVDSRELFELIADNELDGVRSLEGYGVAMWARAADLGSVYMARLNDQSDFEICKTDAGYIWGSTRKIVEQALDACEITVQYWIDTSEEGRVYKINSEGVWITKQEGVTVQTGYPKWLRGKSARVLDVPDYGSGELDFAESRENWKQYIERVSPDE